MRINKKLISTKLVVLILVSIALTSGITYAISSWSSGNVAIKGKTMCFDINYKTGQNISFNNMSAASSFDEANAASTSVTLSRQNNCYLYGIGTLSVTITSTANLTTGALKYRIINNNTGEKIDGTINKTGTISIYNNFNIKDTTIYTIYFWLDSNYIDNSYLATTFSGTIEATVRSAPEYGEIHENLDTSGANIPKLTEGMIPVYYSESDSQWHKADKNNSDSDHQWYDYDSKMWANMVLLNSDTARNTYNNADKGTVINMSDIAAFYVWIPRYKYRVWSINRQACGSENTTTCEAKYAYTAFSTGIEIEFENATSSTGNVVCTYNPNNDADPTSLSDTCIYNGTDTITTTSINTNYSDAWYTHPAFKFGSEQLTGFWIGKFETTGLASEPTILPDTGALVNQNIATQFTTSRLFSTNTTKYGLDDTKVNAHMLKNLEWGAVAYLTHSIYGLCDGTSCGGLYKNDAYNSTTYSTTGRSSGKIADTNYSSYGTYSYDGYTVSTSNVKDTSIRDMSKVSSTTRNIYGVYDMSGGSNEYVMANMYSIPTGTYVGPIGTSTSGFNGVNYSGGTLYRSGNSLLATVTASSITVNNNYLKYWDSYSYGTLSNAQTAWNRSRLGDAMGEVVSGTLITSSWKQGSGVTGSRSGFAASGSPFLRRGGYYDNSNAGSFYLDRFNGDDNANYSFRSALS